MNAAFLLVTTALLAGQNGPPANGDPPANDKKPAPAATAPNQPVLSTNGGGCGSGCGGDCGAASSCGCCDSGCAAPRQGLFSRLKGAFNRGGDCGCGSSSSGGHHARSAGWGGDCGCSDPCASSGGLFSRLRAKFGGGHRGGDCGCASDCGGCNGCGATPGVTGAPGAPGGKVEQLQNPPKEDPGNKMPKGDKGDGNKGAEPPTAQLRPSIPAAPAFETAPTIVPNVPANNQEQRDPPF